MFQTTQFANLNSTTQQLLSELIRQKNAQETSNAAFGNKFDYVQRDINNNRVFVADKLDSLRGDIQLRFKDADQLRMREELLKSLWFPEIDLRRSEIEEPASDTLNWLFEPGDHVGTRLKWPSFRQWLREDISMYWISGKAGSGKSTLMAHIINDQRTFKELDFWRNGGELEVMSFFFWRAGSGLQKNIRGLLRSLLYQLCRLRPSISDVILSRLSSPTGMFPSWTERDLLGHITEAIKSTQVTRFCIFIDGLDEFEDPHDDLDNLVDHLNHLQDLDNVKVCVSSRPELELVNRLRRLKHLRLQDLNYGDIKKFVHQSFVKTNLSEYDRTKMVNEVVQRAEGVFLWASLVTQSLVKGSKAHDDPDIMQARLHSLPRDMNKLFEQMLSNVDDAYRESLALYVQLMMLSREGTGLDEITRVPIVAMLQLKKPINSYEEFANECERKVTQIESRNAGLLQVRSHYYGGRKARWEQSATPRFVNDQPCFQPHFTPRTQQIKRHICGRDEPYPMMLDYEPVYMSWIHRSAFEFFAVLGEKCAILHHSRLRREELLRRISEALISYIEAAPTFRSAQLARNLETLWLTVSTWHDDNPSIASDLLAEVHTMYLQYGPDEFDFKYNNGLSEQYSNAYDGNILFWLDCVGSHLWSYISSRISYISNETTSDLAILNLLACSIRETAYDLGDANSAIRLINSLAEILVRRMVKTNEDGDAMHTTWYWYFSPDKWSRYENLTFENASWRGLVSAEYRMVMLEIMSIIDL